RKNDLPATQVQGLPGLVDRIHTNGPPALEDKLPGGGAGKYVKIFAAARPVVQISYGCGNAAVVLVRHGNGKDAVPGLAIEILSVFEAEPLEGLDEGAAEARPLLGEKSADGHAAFPAMNRAVEVHVALDLPEEGQHILIAPAVGAAALPVVEIRGQSPYGHLSIDTRTASHDLGLLELLSAIGAAVVRSLSRMDPQVPPVIIGVKIRK